VLSKFKAVAEWISPQAGDRSGQTSLRAIQELRKANPIAIVHLPLADCNRQN